LEFTETVHAAFSSKTQVDALYTDFAKAFDKVNIRALIYKLRCSGISGSLLRWMSSYLENRSQLVFLRNTMSSEFQSTSGVPQGSHLGPLLFLLFINDLPSYLEPGVEIALFADDCKFFAAIKSLSDCIRLQKCLQKFGDYCDKFLLKLNLDKCHKITFSRCRSGIIEYDYSLNGVGLSVVSTINDLGIQLDSELSFKDHTNIIYNKALKMMGFVMRSCGSFKNIMPLERFILLM